LTEEKITDKKLSRRQFVGTAAAGAVALGAVAGAKSFAPHVTVAGEKLAIPVAAKASSVGAKAQGAGIPSSWDYTADVVVVGDGGAGTSAAISAYDAGASVLVLEKAPKGLDGGNTATCGMFTTVSPLTDFITATNMLNYGTTPLDVVTAFCTEATNTATWLTSLGATVLEEDMPLGLSSTSTGIPGASTSYPYVFPPSLIAPYVSPGVFEAIKNIAIPSFPYPIKSGPAGSFGMGCDLWAFLDNCRASRGIPIMYQTPAKQLIQNPTTNEIIGVVATDWTGQDINVRANKAVILSCGGCENNREIIDNFTNAPKSLSVAYYGTPYNTGDGLYMTEQVGAKLWHMNRKEYNELACKAGSEEIGVALSLGVTGNAPDTAFATSPVIFVNRYGKRFMNECVTSYELHNISTMEYNRYYEGSAATEGAEMYDWLNVPFYAIFDSVAIKAGPLYYPPGPFIGYNECHKLYTWSEDNSAEIAKGWIIGPADTPADLGALITCRDFFGAVVGMDAAGLDAQVTLWNNMCGSGADTQFGRTAVSLAPLKTPPYYAMELAQCQINVAGGPAHDKYSRTLDPNNNPIPRLYSTGECGTMWDVLYFGGLAEAVATGCIAARHAASLPSWT
jgi:hypothetical protein